LSEDPEKSDHSQFAPIVSSDEGDRKPEHVFGSRRVYLLTQSDQRVVRWTAGVAFVLFSLIGSGIKASDLPFGQAMLILGGSFAVIVAVASGIIWLHLRVAGTPSFAVPKLPFRLQRPDPDSVIWGMGMMCGAFGLAVVVWLFVLGEEVAHHAFEPKLLLPLWMFLAPLICAILGFRWARRKFRKHDQT